MSEHTPGPWRVVESSTLPGLEWRILAADQEYQALANVYSKPDARLIAAAPELLEALRLLRPWLHSLPQLDPKVSGRGSVLVAQGLAQQADRLLGYADTAIAKAESRDS